ncbi:SERTA domain-containing protein 3 [Paramarasmius palmivorus]|uniref:SERTA domain-containing protein 3 n=1 Tax=Paramarasmius palmivorus TaxID=297713 RepID=A0AAW0BPK7_9AGAR
MSPSAFKGSRKAFLEENIPAYAKALKEGRGTDFLIELTRRYFKRYPANLPHSEEPSKEHLESVNDDDPDEEIVPPEHLPDQPEEAFRKALLAHKAILKVIDGRIAQIRRWMNYHVAKTTPKDAGEFDPWAVYLAKLSGVPVDRPGRQRSAANVWMKHKQDEIGPQVQEKIKEALAKKDTEKETETGKDSAPGKGKGKGKGKATRAGENAFVKVRQTVVSDEFNKLNDKERDQWRQVAEEEHRERVRQWQDSVIAPVSTAPADRQACIETLPSFVTPFLEGVAERTGWKVTFIAGGPEPADGGRLNVISVNCGVTTGPVPLNFGQALRDEYQGHIVAPFGQFLKQCYSVAKCQSRALNTPTPSLAHLDIADNTTLHRVDAPVQQSPAPASITEPNQGAFAPSAIPSGTPAPSPANAADAPKEKASVVAKPSTPATVSNVPQISKPAPSRSLPATSAKKTTQTRAVLTGPLRQSSVLKATPPSNNSTLGSTDMNSRRKSPPRMSPRMSPPPPSDRSSPGPIPIVDRSSPEPTLASGASSPTLPPASVRSGTATPDLVELGSSEDEQLAAPSRKRAKGQDSAASTVKKAKNGYRSTRMKPGPAPRPTNKTKFVPYVEVPMPHNTTSTPPPPAASASSIGLSSEYDDLVDTSFTVECPSGAADYAQRTVQMCNGIGMDQKLHDTVALWLSIDGKMGWKKLQGGPSKLTTVRRPDPVAQWIGTARPAQFRSSINNLALYGESYMDWLSECSPEWRRRDPETGMMARDGTDWSAIAVGGVNGIVSLVAALVWWREGVSSLTGDTYRERQTTSRHFDIYREALNEVHYTFQELDKFVEN